MKRLLPWLITLAVLALAGWWLQRMAGDRAVAIEQARVAASEARAHEAVARAQQDTADQLRAERDAYRIATDDATRKATQTTARASGAVRNALDALSDTSATLDSLRGLVRAIGAAWVADSIANADRERAWLARGLFLESVIAADSVALKGAWAALAAERAAHEATKRIPRKGLIARVTPFVLTASVAYLAGALDIP